MKPLGSDAVPAATVNNINSTPAKTPTPVPAENTRYTQLNERTLLTARNFGTYRYTTSKQELPYSKMSEASMNFFASQELFPFHMKDVYLNQKVNGSVSSESNLQGSATAFKPRLNSYIKDSDKNHVFNDDFSSTAQIPPRPTHSQLGPLSNGEYQRTRSSSDFQLTPTSQEFQTAHQQHVRPQDQHNQRQISRIVDFSTNESRLRHNIYNPQRTPFQNVGQGGVQNNQMAMLNPRFDPHINQQQTQMLGLDLQQMYYLHQLVGSSTPPRGLTNHPLHSSAQPGQKVSPKIHGGSPANERYGLANRLGRAHDIDNFQFPSPDKQEGESCGTSEAKLNNYTSHLGTAKPADDSAISNPSQLTAPFAAMYLTTPPRSKIQDPFTGFRDTSVNFVNGIPFGPTPHQPFRKEPSYSAKHQRDFLMPEQTTPTKHMKHGRRQTIDLQSKYGAPPKFDLNAPKSQDLAIAPPAVSQVLTSIVRSHNTIVETGSIEGKSPNFKKLVSTFTQEGNPTFDSAMEFLPLCNQLESAPRANYGVIRIANIPFAVKRSDILAFLGRSARLIPETEGESIHIIMDTLTGKTMDAYVEFISIEEATYAFSKYTLNRAGGRGGRLGERYAEVEIVDPSRLMRALFPRAKHVEWNGYRPAITPYDPTNKFDTPFKGFTAEEELVTLFNHIQQPNRSPFSKDCPQRPYECLISLMLKFPWSMTRCILVRERNIMWKTVLDSVTILKDAIENDQDNSSMCLTRQLLQRLCRATRQCNGFTIAQKFEIHRIAGVTVHWDVPNPDEWIWLALGPVKTLLDETDVLEFYISLINTLSNKKLSHYERHQVKLDSQKELCNQEFNHTAWGPIRINYPADYEIMTMSQIAALEHRALEECFSELPL